MTDALVFYAISSIIVLFAILVVTARSTVYSILFLVVDFLAVALLYASMNSFFVAAIQVLVYAGGIVVLYLFVVMLVNLKRAPEEFIDPRRRSSLGFALSAAKLGLPLWVAVALGPLTALIGAVLFGALCVRLSHIYLAMLTLACSEIVFTVLFQAYDYTGGDNGITSFMTPRFGLSPQIYGAICIAIVGLSIAFLARVVRSPLGLAIQAVGEEPHRAAALGFNPRLVQLTAYVISGTLAGLAGTMYAVFHGNAFPDYAGIGLTVDALVMVVIGGVKGFYGGVLGAIVYVLLRTFVSRSFEHWELVIGLILLAVVLIFPAGVSRLLSRLGLKRDASASKEARA